MLSDNVILWNMNEQRNETDGIGNCDREKESEYRARQQCHDDYKFNKNDDDKLYTAE